MSISTNELLVAPSISLLGVLDMNNPLIWSVFHFGSHTQFYSVLKSQSIYQSNGYHFALYGSFGLFIQHFGYLNMM
jgi:hypothetical protein